METPQQNLEHKTFICECHSLEHQLHFWYDDEDKNVYTEVHLVKYGFFNRVKYALKYIFGYKCRFGAFDEFIFKPEDLTKLKEYLKDK